jgi:hypothetical protein
MLILQPVPSRFLTLGALLLLIKTPAADTLSSPLRAGFAAIVML